MDSGFESFFGQLPPILYIVFCGSSILLMIVVAYLVNARGKRARALAAGGTVNVPPAPVMATAQSSGDLPDLDDLLKTDELSAPRETRASSGTFTVRLAEGTAVEVVEVLTVLRDVADGNLIVQIGDKAYRNPPASADAEFKRRFNNTLRDLATPARQTVPPPVIQDDTPLPAPPPPPAPPAPPAPSAAAVVVDTKPASDPTPAVKPTTVTSVPGDLPKFKLSDSPPEPPKRGRRPPATPIPELNIAAAIEAFLQHKLTMTPEYSARSIHVKPALHGGVTIEVDGKFYDSVGEVDDVQVREFLSTTIAEWQSRQ